MGIISGSSLMFTIVPGIGEGTRSSGAHHSAGPQREEPNSDGQTKMCV